MSPSRIAAAVILGAALTCSARALARSDDPIRFPAEFRQWAHVKSVLVGPEAPSFPTEGGIHHIYANPKALDGYRTGRFPDGSVVVYNLLETTAARHGLGAVEDADVIEAEEAAGEQVVALGVFAVHPPGEIE